MLSIPLVCCCVSPAQRALSCAARHLTWSSMWGAWFGEDGRYDAFATLMEILAARLRHPDTPPQVRMCVCLFVCVCVCVCVCVYNPEAHNPEAMCTIQNHSSARPVLCVLQDLIKVDPHFAKFARCELGGEGCWHSVRSWHTSFPCRPGTMCTPAHTVRVRVYICVCVQTTQRRRVRLSHQAQCAVTRVKTQHPRLVCVTTRVWLGATHTA